MAYQALYRKYRPQKFSDVVGQEHITETLKNELATGTTVHAYLFTGTRGTGKTTCAKILAKSINCLNPINGDPCLECEACNSIASGENTDIVEIDAASNNSVENIRELRDMVAFTPANSKYRVYIIDEVHMLSISAFNALLKTLEEPPAHVVFILATTEVHKLPATILSRCQRFDFKRIEPEKICERIKFIAENEGLTVTDEAATLIASAADGGMRDALSILDLCASSTKNIDEATVSEVCAMAGNDYLLKLAGFIKDGDCEKALLTLDELHRSSVDMQRLLGELILHYRNLMILKTVKGKNLPIVCSGAQLELLKAQAENYSLQSIMYALSVLQNSTLAMQTGNRRCEMEMAVIRLCNPEISKDLSALEARVSALENGAVKVKKPNEEASVKKAQPQKYEKPAEDEIPLPEAPDEAIENDVAVAVESVAKESKSGLCAVDNWSQVIGLLKKKNPLIAGVLNGSSAFIEGDLLLIDAPNEQFRSMINGSESYRNAIRTAAETVLGKVYKLGPYQKKESNPLGDPLADFANKLKNFEI